MKNDKFVFHLRGLVLSSSAIDTYVRARCMTAVGANFQKNSISQGSVAMRLRCGGIFNVTFIANFLETVLVKEFLKSLNICWRHELERCLPFYWLTVYICTITIYAITDLWYGTGQECRHLSRNAIKGHRWSWNMRKYQLTCCVMPMMCKTLAVTHQHKQNVNS